MLVAQQKQVPARLDTAPSISPDSRIAGMPNERAGSTAAACSRPPECDAPASTVE